MIELSVKDYCQECPDFDTKVTIKDEDGDAIVDEFGVVSRKKVIHTTVTCKHAKRCEGIKRYLERMEKERADG